MEKEILRLVQASDFHRTDEQHLSLGPRGINIWYSYNYNNSRLNVTQINSLSRKIRNDFPNIRFSSMEICVPTETVSPRHAGQVFVKVRVYLDQFLHLRKKETFGIL